MRVLLRDHAAIGEKRREAVQSILTDAIWGTSMIGVNPERFHAALIRWSLEQGDTRPFDEAVRIMVEAASYGLVILDGAMIKPVPQQPGKRA